MSEFQGFPNGDISFVQLPELLFEQIIPLIDDANELKLTLYYYWAISQQEGSVRYLRLDELVNSDTLTAWMDAKSVQNALKKALTRKTLLLGQARHTVQMRCLFPNSMAGRAVAEALQNGSWYPGETDHLPFNGTKPSEKNLYELYEKNIGPLTPLLAEDLKAAQEEYPTDWIEEAIRTAVQSNVRNWRYIEAILRSWKKEGKNADTRRNSTKDGRRSSTGEYDEFIQH